MFQRRINGSVDFYRDWAGYASGFGDVEGEYWLGNYNIHIITNTAGKTHGLRVELDDGIETRVALYDSFSISEYDDSYSLNLGTYLPDSDAGGETVTRRVF